MKQLRKGMTPGTAPKPTTLPRPAQDVAVNLAGRPTLTNTVRLAALPADELDLLRRIAWAATRQVSARRGAPWDRGAAQRILNQAVDRYWHALERERANGR